MKPGYAANIGQSKFKAIGQFRQLENKLARNPPLGDDYKAFMDEYRNLGHMRLANKTHLLPYYLPHHGVLRMESTTTKLRVVFNASAKTSSGLSLNDVMECGPNLQKDLMGLILQWRQYTYVLTADIEKMYRQILVREEDQHLQRIIWRDSPQETIQEYELTTVTYGTKAAPFLAMRTLHQLARDEAARYPLAAPAVEHSFYMDDLLSGHYTLDQSKELRLQLIEIMKSAGMNLRKWSSNAPGLVEDLTAEQLNAPFDFKCTETRKTLGLRWNSQPDTFTFHSHELQAKRGNHTKRELLSEISKLFDPLGIPRYLGNILQNYEIHCFCDASEKAYACVVYIVTSDHKGMRTSNIVAAKTKLAPLKKKVSLPRLELCGALLSSQLVSKVLRAIPHEKASAGSRETNRWSQFIANRVQQITDVIPASRWHHVKSEENAADCATRGLTSKQLASDQTLWWRGPQWILNNPNDIIHTQYPEPDIEIKKSKIVAIAQLDTDSIIKQLLCAHSSINRVAKIIAWITRFIARCRNPLRQQIVNEAPNKSLTSTEINKAYECIIKYDQSIEFTEEINDLRKMGHVKTNSKLANLCPFMDDNGLLRVGGRLKNSNIRNTAKHPIILSKQSRFTELVIEQAHKTTLHGGAKLTLSHLRDRYWVLSGMNTVKKQVRRCVTCRRYSRHNLDQIMADLPKPRVTPSRPFTHCGVDFTGHVEVKANKGRGIKTSKGYVAIFVCLSTKAVHLELVSDLSTPTFLAAFRRMCARRGTPKEMYSDNGTNFIGASKLLRKEYEQAAELIKKDFINSISELGISWNFNAPTWASAGGLWESAVRSMKYHLRRVLGTQKLTFEEFTTLLTQIEACLNSRPLCSLSEDPDDIDSLTPGHFLIGGPILSNSHQNSDSEGIPLPIRWQLVQTMARGFWKKWSHEYLQSLQQRSKWITAKEDIKINDVVVVKDDNLPPTRWALGRVLDVHPGMDEHVRVVTLKTKGGIMKRPITKLCLLPVHKQEDVNNDQQNISSEDVKATSSSSPNNKTTSQTAQPSGKRPRRKTSKYSVSNIIFTLLSILALSTQQEVTSSPSVCNITSLQNENQSLYFDQVTELQQILDEWKLVVYYNMSTYWQGLSNMDQYILHLKELCVPNSQYNSIIYQLDHEMQEIRHYNRLLKQHALNRQKRGLINGAGYLANSLFGVLDDRFAQ
ncbi:hypothetical protein ABMA28_009850 [Loxostege sticticalis]|uniref:Integrase catalytic domain-containing protein n=1 Tax=Loxostege sticticalis TaxID=481309 RepID=A0ABD0SBL9_LOXSC